MKVRFFGLMRTVINHRRIADVALHVNRGLANPI